MVLARERGNSALSQIPRWISASELGGCAVLKLVGFAYASGEKTDSKAAAFAIMARAIRAWAGSGLLGREHQSRSRAALRDMRSHIRQCRSRARTTRLLCR